MKKMDTETAIRFMRSIRRTPANWICEYEAIDIAIEALEKQIPKEPDKELNKYPYYDDGYISPFAPKYISCCPNCGVELDEYAHHCECGQTIDWSEQ